ncbi:MAG TPA: DUF4432 domain-containing protein [Planctomycetaceae bacterium]|nr:DUF4432 domain-containing protein [Planctomycetaceae bacterium]
MSESEIWELCGEQAEANLKMTSAEIDGSPEGWFVTKTTMKAGLSAGVEVIEVNNGAQSLFILPTRGMGLWKIQAGDLRVGWDSPVKQPVHPAFVDLKSRNKLGWLDGFNELVTRCGLTSNGPPGIDETAGAIESDITLHGRIANLPATSVTFQLIESDGKTEIVVRGTVSEATLFGQHLELVSEYRTALNSHEVTITDSVTNRSGRGAELQLLYHINIGSPILEEGSTWHAPLKRLTPRDARATEELDTYSTYREPTTGYAEEAFFCNPISDSDGFTPVLLTNSSQTEAVSLDFETAALPCLTIWKNTQSLADGYCTGLEPGTNYPNFKAQERREGRIVKLAAGANWQASMKLSVLTDSNRISSKLDQITQLQSQAELQIDRNLVKGISGDQ